MIYIRSALFNILFFIWTALCSIAGRLLFFLPPEKAYPPAGVWSRGSQRLLSFVAGIKQEHWGVERIPDPPFIIACKHESTWETTIFQGLLPWPAVIIKKEILSLPLFGKYCEKLEMIAIDRDAGPSALRGMLRAAKKAVSQGRSIVIFPEGTRSGEKGANEYQTGIYGLYHYLKIPVVPVALNSRVFWLNDSFLRKPGTIIMEYLPPLEPGLGREEFMSRLRDEIEKESWKLTQLAQSGGTETEKGSDQGNPGSNGA